MYIYNQLINNIVHSYMNIQLFEFGYVIYDSQIVHQWNGYEKNEFIYKSFRILDISITG